MPQMMKGNNINAWHHQINENENGNEVRGLTY